MKAQTIRILLMKITSKRLFALKKAALAALIMLASTGVQAQNIIRMPAPVTQHTPKTVLETVYSDWVVEQQCDDGTLISNTRMDFTCSQVRTRTVTSFLKNVKDGTLVQQGEPTTEAEVLPEVKDSRTVVTLTNGFVRYTHSNGAQYVGAMLDLFGTAGTFNSSHRLGVYLYKVTSSPGYWLGVSVNNIANQDIWRSWHSNIDQVRIHNWGGDLLHVFDSVTTASYTSNSKLAAYWAKPTGDFGNLYDEYYNKGSRNYIIRIVMK